MLLIHRLLHSPAIFKTPYTHEERCFRDVKAKNPRWSWTHIQQHRAPEPRLCPTLPGAGWSREEAKQKMAVICLCQPPM